MKGGSIGKFGGTEVLEAVDLLVAEKGIAKDSVAKVLEDVFAEVLREKYGPTSDVRVKMNNQSGQVEALRVMRVVEKPTNADIELSLIQASRIDPKAKIGDVINQKLPEIGADRHTAGIIKNGILKRIRALEKIGEFEEYKDRINQLVYGRVKTFSRSACILGIGTGNKTEALMKQDGMVPGEIYNASVVGDGGKSIVVVIEDVIPSAADFQIIVSRSSPKLLEALIAEEVPEVKDGNVEIRAIARNAGSRTKVAVWSPDAKIDAVGACIGPRGSRIMKIVDMLNGEKIDIIPWDRDVPVFAKNLIVPAKALRVEVDTDVNGAEIIRIIVDENELSLAIGKRGQNVRLASQMLGKPVEIISEKERQQQAMEKMNNTAKEIIDALDVDDIVAKLLMSEGFVSVAQLAEAQLSRIASIGGFNEQIATELQSRAKDYINSIEERYKKLAEEVKFDKAIEGLPSLSTKNLITLIENNIKTMQDVADLAADELVDLLGKGQISYRNAAKVVMEARRLVYNILA